MFLGSHKFNERPGVNFVQLQLDADVPPVFNHQFLNRTRTTLSRVGQTKNDRITSGVKANAVCVAFSQPHLVEQRVRSVRVVLGEVSEHLFGHKVNRYMVNRDELTWRPPAKVNEFVDLFTVDREPQRLPKA